MAETTSQTIDLTVLLKDVTDQWVALSADQRHVVGSGKSPKEALEKAQERRESQPVLLAVPTVSGPYLFGHLLY